MSATASHAVDSAARTEPEPRLVLFDGAHAAKLEEVEDIPSRLGRSQLLWVDAESLSSETSARLASALRVEHGVLLETSQGPGRRNGPESLRVTFRTPDVDGSDVTELTCVVGKRWIVTMHERPVPVLADLGELAEGSGPTGRLSGPNFLATLFEWVLSAYSASFDRLEEELEELDERAMRGRGSAESHIEALVGLRRRAGRLRRELATHRPILLALTQPEFESLGDEEDAERFRGLLGEYETALQSAGEARASVVSSFDVLIARTGHRTNEIMKVLTLASVILLPGSLLAGVMGMNFKVSLFEHTSLFWVVIAVIVAVAAVTVAVAKGRRWI